MRIATIKIQVHSGHVTRSLITGVWCGIYVHCVAFNHMLAIEKARKQVQERIDSYNNK